MGGRPFKRNLTTDGPISPGEVSESLVNQPLSESPLCLFTATTVTVQEVGRCCVGKKSKEKKVKREASEAAGGCCSTEVID